MSAVAPMSPMYLIDGWPDGAIEERAWVEITSKTNTHASAIEYLEKEMPIEDVFPDDPDCIVYVVTGTTWQRPAGHPVEGDDEIRVERPLDQYGPCRSCGGTKKISIIAKIEQRTPPHGRTPAERLAAPPNVRYLVGLPATERNLEKINRAGAVVTKRSDERCEDCHGTGKEADWLHGDDGFPWEECKEGDPEAMYFWTIEAQEKPEDYEPPVNVSDDQITLDDV